MKNKIGIDFTYILDDTVTGIRKYGEEIVEGIKKVNKDYEIVLFVNKQLEKAFIEKFPDLKIVPLTFLFKDIRYVKRINTINVFRKMTVKKEKCDIIIYPYVSKYTQVIKNAKKIIGILDIIPLDEIKDKESLEYKKTKNEYVRLMNKTKHITTISNYSKDRLLDINPNFEGKIDVIPSSVEAPKDTEKDVTEIINTNSKYIFSINSFLKHKNQITLVKAFNRIKEQIPHKLVLVRKTRAKFTNYSIPRGNGIYRKK